MHMMLVSIEIFTNHQIHVPDTYTQVLFHSSVHAKPANQCKATPQT